LNPNEPEEQASTPIELPSTIEFSGENSDNCVGDMEFRTRLHEQLDKWSRVVRLDHLPEIFHRMKNLFLVSLHAPRTVVAGAQRFRDHVRSEPTGIHRQVNAR